MCCGRTCDHGVCPAVSCFCSPGTCSYISRPRVVYMRSPETRCRWPLSLQSSRCLPPRPMSIYFITGWADLCQFTKTPSGQLTSSPSGAGMTLHPPALNKCRSGGGYIIVGHVFIQLPVSVSSGNKQGYAWLALHEVAAKRGPRRGMLQLTHSNRWGSENCNLHFLPPPPS